MNYIEILVNKNKELEREIDAKDSLITSYKVEGAKLFHENERLKKRIEELEKIEG